MTNMSYNDKFLFFYEPIAFQPCLYATKQTNFLGSLCFVSRKPARRNHLAGHAPRPGLFQNPA